MTTLQTFANGDTNYVAKLNNNFETLGALLDGIQATQQAQVAAVTGSGSAFSALFGPSVAVVGAGSYAASTSGTDLLIEAGYNWKPSAQTVVSNPTQATLHFATYAAGTYYVSADTSGAPVFSLTNDGNAIYSVVWTGSAFGAITRLAAVVWGAEDDIAAQVSAALGASYDTLDARLEAGETKAVAGDLARTWQTGRLSLSVAGSTDVTLTDVQANNTILNFTGALAGNINVVVPLGTKPRMWIVTNNTTGAYTLTVKGVTGTGVAVAQGDRALLYQNGTDVKSAMPTSGAGSGDVAGPASATDGHLAQFDGATGKLLKDGIALDIDTTLAANSDTRVASQKAVKAYVDGIVTGGAADVMIFKGLIDCSANPNYPAADAGNLYKISVAGKIGGASGIDVEAGDTIYCLTDGTASGTQAAVGANWNIAQANITTAGDTLTSEGALINSATSKATPVDADYLGLMDSAASNILKKLSWANLKAALKTYFDTLYATVSQPFDVHAFYPGIPTASAKVLRVPIARAVTFPANFSGSYFAASANATGTTVFDVQKNGSSIGSVSIAAGGTTATFTTSGGAAQSLVAGDVLSIIAPATPDATLADAGFVLAGTR